jgi:hypothetical protein
LTVVNLIYAGIIIRLEFPPLSLFSSFSQISLANGYPLSGYWREKLLHLFT